MLISEEYKKLNESLHGDKASYGTSGVNYIKNIMFLASGMKSQDVLDYGCGKSTLANNLPFAIKQYDPAIPKHSDTPEPADIVVCTDVLEHIEPDLVDNVIADLARVTKKKLFATIANGPAKKTLADGRNAHLIQEPDVWWLTKLSKHFNLLEFNRLDASNDTMTYHTYVVLLEPVTAKSTS